MDEKREKVKFMGRCGGEEHKKLTATQPASSVTCPLSLCSLIKGEFPSDRGLVHRLGKALDTRGWPEQKRFRTDKEKKILGHKQTFISWPRLTVFHMCMS